jgi:multiple sugar transport system permease protein
MKDNRFVLLVLAPVFLLITVFLVVPLFYGLGISFFSYNPLRDSNPFVGLSNYAALFQDRVFGIAVANTLLFVSVTVCLNIVVTLLLAQLISTLSWRRAGAAFRALFFLPCVAPLVAASVVWGTNIFGTRTSVINAALALFQVPPVNFLGDQGLVMYSLIIFTLWADFGYNTILFSAGLDSIPAQFKEAATTDGAGPLQCFFRVTFPLLGRTFAFVVIVTVISHFEMFVQFMVLAYRGGPNNATTVLTLYVYKLAFINKDMGYASAVAMVLFAIIMGVTLMQRRLSRVDWGY